MRNPTRFFGLSALVLLTVASMGGAASAKDSTNPTDPCIRSISCRPGSERPATDPYIRSLVQASGDQVGVNDPYVRSLISPDAGSVRVVALPQRTEKVLVGNHGWGEGLATGLAGVVLGVALMGTASLFFGRHKARSAI